MPAPCGNAATPQKHAQLQAAAFPLLFHPGASDVVAGGATAVDVAGGSPPLSTVSETAPPEATVEVAAAVPFCEMAASLNTANDFSAVGLMANTIPAPQCTAGVFCLQYHPVLCQQQPVCNGGGVAYM